MKIEPMSAEQIKRFLACVDWEDEPVDDVARVILAWAHERASRGGTIGGWAFTHNLKQVLDEIGWPKEGR